MKATALHLALVALLLVAGFTLPLYHQGNLARVMVFAVYAMGYNLLFGYTGLLSLGHALFFGAGMYAMGLAMQFAALDALPALALGLLAGALVSLAVGLLALRTIGVAFMIVTLMFAQTGYLVVLYFGRWTRGDEGFVLGQELRHIGALDLSEPVSRYLVAWALFSGVLIGSLWLVRSGFGHVLVAIRENEERTRMLGYDVTRHKLAAMVLSGTLSAASGAAYGLLFGYVGASFTAVQYSILPLLWVLLGGAGTTLGPFIGTLFMFYLIDYASGFTSAYMLLAGAALVLLVLFARAGIVGEMRNRWFTWLP